MAGPGAQTSDVRSMGRKENMSRDYQNCVWGCVFCQGRSWDVTLIDPEEEHCFGVFVS